MKKTLLSLAMLLIGVGAWAGPTDLPEITTDVNNPVYYTIYNTRSTQPGGLMYWAGDAVGIKDGGSSATLEDKYKFYFTGTHDALYVHNAATGNKLATIGNGNKSAGSWTEEGIAWRVLVSPQGGGLAFGPSGSADDATNFWNECNYSTDADKPDFTTWSANDAGSIFVVERADQYTFPEVEKFYTIECPLFENVQGVENKKGLFVDESGNLKWNTVNLANENFYWTVSINVDGSVTLKNHGTGKFLNGTAMSEDAVSSTIHAIGSNLFNIKVGDTTIHANGHSNGNGSSGNIVNWTGLVNSASAWRFVEQEDPSTMETVTLTYSFIWDGDEKYTQTETMMVGDEYPEITVTLPYGISATKPAGNVEGTGEVTKEIQLEKTKDLPFEAAGNPEDISVWYYIRMHTNQPGYLGDINGDLINVANGKTAAKDDANIDNYKWGFAGNVFDGIQVVNYGTNKLLTSTGSGNVTLSDEGTKLFVSNTAVTGNNNAINGFCLSKDASSNYMNANYKDGKLSHWQDRDAGSTFFLTPVDETYSLTISDKEYSTLFLDYAVKIPAEVEAYIVSGTTSSSASLTKIEGTLKENTGVIIKGTANETYDFVASAEERATTTGNMLLGTLAKETITKLENTSYYVLAAPEGVVGFFNAGNGGDNKTFVNAANKAYLEVAAEASARFLNFDFGTETAIESIQGAENGAVIYDLAGRRVQNAQKGLYIVNGKKVIK